MFHDIDNQLFTAITANQAVFTVYFAEDLHYLCFYLATATESDLDSIRKALG